MLKIIKEISIFNGVANSPSLQSSLNPQLRPNKTRNTSIFILCLSIATIVEILILLRLRKDCLEKLYCERVLHIHKFCL